MSERGEYNLNSVFIADRDKQTLDQLMSLFLRAYGIEPKILENEETFNGFIQRPEGGAVFIRIDSPAVDGLRFSSLAMQFNPDIQLVWMATSGSYALDAFTHGADAYLLLPAKEENLREVMDSLSLRKEKTKITFKSNSGGRNEK